MMVKVFLVAALVLCVLGVEASTLKDTILTDSHRCCVSSCTSQERESLEKQMALYELQDHDDAYIVRSYFNKAASGDACSDRHSKRTADGVTMKVPYGPYDVGSSDVSFSADVTIFIGAGIYYSYCYASTYFNNTQSSTIYPNNNYYYFDSGSTNTTSIVKTLTLIIPRYAYYGNWTFLCYAYGFNYNVYVSASATFNVLHTSNDVAPPKLLSLFAPVFNYYDDDRSISCSASDDMSGVQSIQIYVTNSTSSTLASGTAYVPYVNGKYLGQTSWNSAVMYFYNYTILYPGTYDLTVYVYDVLGSYSYYSAAQLKALGMQSQIVIAVGSCKAGRKLPYGTTGTCTLCDKGTFSNFGAFRCKACPPGTASNVAGATSCVQCPPGTAGIGGSAGCEICPAGTFTSGFGNSECQPCYPGTNSTDGSEYCSSCPAGTYSLGGTASCSACPPGTASSSGTFYCGQCVPGTYTSNYGSSMCQVCPAGTYSWVGYTSCSACPSPTLNGPPGSNSRLNCY